MECESSSSTLLTMWLRQIDDWKLGQRLLRPMGTEILWMKGQLTYSYWVEMELRREEARTEFVRRGYLTSEIVQIETGDWFAVIANHKRMAWLRTVA